MMPVSETPNLTFHGRNIDTTDHCENGALMTPFGIIIQAVLAFIAFSTLMLKRLWEPSQERRPWKIWFYDTSKNALGACMIHIANVLLADMFLGDPCTWYIINFLLDSTIGLLFIYLALKLTQFIVRRKKCNTLLFGEYGDPPQCNAWVGQCGLYLLVIIFEKTSVLMLIQFKFWEKVQKFFLSPIKNPKVEVVVVMLVIPFLVNAIMFWVVDNFLMKKHHREKEPGQSAGSRVLYCNGPLRGNAGPHDSEADMLLSLEEESDVMSYGKQSPGSDQDGAQALIPTASTTPFFDSD